MKKYIPAIAFALLAFVLSAAPNVAALEKALADATADARRPRTLHWTFDVGAKALVEARQYETAEKLLDRALALDGLAPRRRVDLAIIKVDLLFNAKRRDEARKLGDALVASKEDPVRALKAAARAHRLNMLDADSPLAYYDRYLDRPEAIGAKPAEHRQIMKDYVAGAEWAMDRARLEKAAALCEKYGFGKIEGIIALLPILREADGFPGEEKDVFIPKDLADFGVDPRRKVVHAKDFGWNPTNATECLTKAVNSDATTVIVDDMGSPWRLWSVRFEKKTGSNKQIVFRKGVTVLSAPLHGRKGEPGWYRADMFDCRGVSNIVFIGEGELGKDVYIGMYPSRAARYASGFAYGGTCIGGQVRNILVKNLRLANNLSDGFCMTGSYHYLVDCILDDNYRQGLSIVNGHHGVYKNVTFCNTVGGEPHNGVDFEPPYPLYSCHEQRFYDCVFTNNAAGNVIFSIGTYAPVTALFKRCYFAAGRHNNISFYEKQLHYASARRKAPSNIIFEDCRIDGYAEADALRMNGNIFDVTFRNCTFNECGRIDRTRKPIASPFRLALDSAYCHGFYPWPGRILFENVKVNGWRGKPLVRVTDFVGRVAINGFAGMVDFNGEKVDMSAYSYLPPDLALGEVSEPAGRDLVGRTVASDTAAAPGFIPDFDHMWYQPMPSLEYLAAGKKGARATFSFNNLAKPLATGAFVIRSPSGKIVTVGSAKLGVCDYDYVFAEDGVHAFLTKWLDAGVENDGRFYDMKATGVALSYLAVSNDAGRVSRVRTAPGTKRYVGYFEVPANRACNLKLMCGGVEICDETGAPVLRVASDEYVGSKLVTFTPKAHAIWSFRALNGRLDFKMFPPLTAIWSDDPENLVATRAGLPFCRVGAADVGGGAAPAVVVLPAKYEAEVARLAAARIAQAKKGKAVPAYEQAEKDLAAFKKLVDGPGAEREVVDMTTRLHRLKRFADAEKAALSEDEETRRMAALCAKYATVYAPEEIGGWECSVKDDVFTYAHVRGLKGLYATLIARLP